MLPATVQRVSVSVLPPLLKIAPPTPVAEFAEKVDYCGNERYPARAVLLCGPPTQDQAIAEEIAERAAWVARDR